MIDSSPTLHRYQHLPDTMDKTVKARPQQPSRALLAAAGSDAVVAVAASSRMRCGGCGAKVGATVLSRVLRKLGVAEHTGDDAAVVDLRSTSVVASVDFFRSFIDDPFVLGAVAATHAMGDAWAMGTQPCAALAICQVPHAPAAQTEREVLALMAGALHALNAASCRLVGGHTCEGAELACGFTVLAPAPVQGEQLLRKGGLHHGDVLLLTKPIGTGTLMAAAAAALASGRHVARALESMRQPQGPAAAVLLDCGVSGATDITGFGLLGHAAEMAVASNVQLRIDLDRVPLLPGAAELAAGGQASSLAPANVEAAMGALGSVVAPDVTRHRAYPLIFDPQTAGGLLAGVAPQRAQEAIRRLVEAGFEHTAVIGEVLAGEDASGSEHLITLRAGTHMNGE
jgi:selenide, water dikinase